METNVKYIIEAERIGNYLLNVPIQKSEKETYVSAMQQLNIQLSSYEQILWNSMMISKWKMACIDAGLALKDPNNSVRRKLFTMLAILEASPNYTTYFLSRNFSFFYFLKLIGVGTRAVFRAIVGLILVKNIQRRCN